jgi:hypothetical protein
MQHCVEERQKEAGRAGAHVEALGTDLRRLRLRRHFFQSCYLIGLGTFASLDDVELYLITFFEALIAFALDRAVVNEDVCSAFTAEKSVALCVVEPLNCALVLCHLSRSHSYLVLSVDFREVKVLQR